MGDRVCCKAFTLVLFLRQGLALVFKLETEILSFEINAKVAMY